MMKNLSTVKLLSMICVLVWCGNSVQAQELTFGGRVGTSISYLSNNFRLNGGNPGLVLGGLANYQLADAIQITGGIDYHQIRGSVHGTPTAAGEYTRTRESNITFHTFEASALGGYKLPLSFLGDAAPYLQGGLSIGWNIGTIDHYSAVYRNTTNGGQFTLRGKENVGSLSERWLPAWNLGLRFEVPVEGGLFSKMMLDFRFRSSMGPALNPYPLTGSTTNLGLRSLSATIGFTL